MKNSNKLTNSNKANFNTKPVKAPKPKPIIIKGRVKVRKKDGSFWETLIECIC